MNEYFVRDLQVPWDQVRTLEDWVRDSLSQGKEEEVIKIIRVLPETSREKYRAIWKEFKRGKT